ncbi:unnamed protein product [Dicrocoelium dendriticum]|nr:unnamed protein product [Dicrocoelium dendriticum]
MSPVHHLDVNKVNELHSFVLQCGPQELHASFVSVMDVIFGFSEHQDGWNLHSLTESNDPHLFTCIRKMLSPSGSFIDCITSKLSVENSSFKFDFPVYLLSVSFYSVS